jgi:NO-binding membrane sensor protein with MHYT domain
MYENRRDRLLTSVEFAWRVFGHVNLAIGVAAIALYIGMAGYHYVAGLNWIDSLLNASMILGGMGPVDPLKTDASKLFASFYALFSGLFFIGVLGLLLAPFIHRVMHRLHMDEERRESA